MVRFIQSSKRDGRSFLTAILDVKSCQGYNDKTKRRKIIDSIAFLQQKVKFIMRFCNKIARLAHILFEPFQMGGVDLVIDTQLVRSAKEGNQESFARVYDLIAPELYKVALFTLQNAQDAEDAVSETFIEAFKGIKNLRDEASFKYWIMTILSVRCKRRIAGYIKERGNMDIDEMIEMPAQPQGAEESEKVSVRDALTMISAEEREIVMLATVQGYTTREVAEMLNLPHGTVSSKLHRTLKKLRQILE